MRIFGQPIQNVLGMGLLGYAASRDPAGFNQGAQAYAQGVYRNRQAEELRRRQMAEMEWRRQQAEAEAAQDAARMGLDRDRLAEDRRYHDATIDNRDRGLDVRQLLAILSAGRGIYAQDPEAGAGIINGTGLGLNVTPTPGYAGTGAVNAARVDDLRQGVEESRTLLPYKAEDLKTRAALNTNRAEDVNSVTYRRDSLLPYEQNYYGARNADIRSRTNERDITLPYDIREIQSRTGAYDKLSGLRAQQIIGQGLENQWQPKLWGSDLLNDQMNRLRIENDIRTGGNRGGNTPPLYDGRLGQSGGSFLERKLGLKPTVDQDAALNALAPYTGASTPGKRYPINTAWSTSGELDPLAPNAAEMWRVVEELNAGAGDVDDSALTPFPPAGQTVTVPGQTSLDRMLNGQHGVPQTPRQAAPRTAPRAVPRATPRPASRTSTPRQPQRPAAKPAKPVKPAKPGGRFESHWEKRKRQLGIK